VDEEREVNGRSRGTKSPKISSQPSPITTFKHPSALSVSNNVVDWTRLTQAARDGLAIASAQCKRMFESGDRRLLSADFSSKHFPIASAHDLGGFLVRCDITNTGEKPILSAASRELVRRAVVRDRI
jgi:hypothetical protein